MSLFVGWDSSAWALFRQFFGYPVWVRGYGTHPTMPIGILRRLHLSNEAYELGFSGTDSFQRLIADVKGTGEIYSMVVLARHACDWHVPRRARLRAKQTRHGSYPRIRNSCSSSKGHRSLAAEVEIRQ